MRRMTPLFIALLVMVKLLLASMFLYQCDLETFFFSTDAIASEPVKPSEKSPRDGQRITHDSLNELKTILKRKAELQEQEQAIENRKAELIAIQEDITRKISELSKLREEIRAEISRKKSLEEQEVSEKKAFEEQKMKHLIKAYSSMKPQVAASLVEKLETAFAVELLSRMKGDVVGNILSFVELEKAAKISEGLVKRD
jgi:flagellar motility protein MotE (MotC chaperone)